MLNPQHQPAIRHKLILAVAECVLVRVLAALQGLIQAEANRFTLYLRMGGPFPPIARINDDLASALLQGLDDRIHNPTGAPNLLRADTDIQPISARADPTIRVPPVAEMRPGLFDQRVERHDMLWHLNAPGNLRGQFRFPLRFNYLLSRPQIRESLDLPGAPTPPSRSSSHECVPTVLQLQRCLRAVQRDHCVA